MLFYYWTGSRNRPYRSQQRYGMGAGFKPRAGQITFSSVIGQGILHEMECADSGALTVEGDVEPCRIGLYTVTLSSGSTWREFTVLCGLTDSCRVLSKDECKVLLSLPVKGFTEGGSRSPHWLKRSGPPHELDKLVNVGALMERGGGEALPGTGGGNGADKAARQRPKGCAGPGAGRAGGQSQSPGGGAGRCHRRPAETSVSGEADHKAAAGIDERTGEPVL